jgi:hypothetical protein
MSAGAKQYQGSVNIRLEEINNCGEASNDLVIPGSRFARPGMTEHAQILVVAATSSRS